MLAVKPWRKFLPATGPISPLQKKPATGIEPISSRKVRASWSGSPKRPMPRPLQEQSSAPATSRPSSSRRALLSSARRSSSAARGVAHLELHRLALARHGTDGDGARLAVEADDVADEEVAAVELVAVLVHRQADEEVAHGRVPGLPACRRRNVSPSTFIAGRMPIELIWLPSTPVIVQVSPSGAAPCETTVLTS